MTTGTLTVGGWSKTMGYNTCYSLKTFGGNPDLSKEINNSDFPLQDDGDGMWCPYDACKWYDHADDISALSKKYPEVLFELYGEGEEAGDLWKKFFLEGLCINVKAQITMPVPRRELLALGGNAEGALKLLDKGDTSYTGDPIHYEEDGALMARAKNGDAEAKAEIFRRLETTP